MAVHPACLVFLLLLSYSAVSPSSARVILAPDAVLDDDVDVTPDVASPDGVLCDVAGCEYDLQLYCLNNGVIVMGSCSLKNTLCKDGERVNSLRLADGWDVCFQATYTVQHHQQQQQPMVIVHTNQEHSTDNDLAIQSAETQPISQAAQDDDDDDDDDDNNNNSDDGDIIAAETSHAGSIVDEQEDDENGQKKSSDQDIDENNELVSQTGGIKTSGQDDSEQSELVSNAGGLKASDQNVGQHGELVSEAGGIKTSGLEVVEHGEPLVSMAAEGMKTSDTDADLFDIELEQQLVQALTKQRAKDDAGSGDVE